MLRQKATALSRMYALVAGGVARGEVKTACNVSGVTRDGMRGLGGGGKVANDSVWLTRAPRPVAAIVELAYAQVTGR